MVKYNKFYTTDGFPIITEDQIATVGRDGGKINRILTGALDFSKPFVLSFTVKNLPYGSNAQSIITSYLDKFNTDAGCIDIYHYYNNIVLKLQHIGNLEFTVDREDNKTFLFIFLLLSSYRNAFNS